MNGNPYMDILHLMRKHGAKVNSPSLLLGEVVSVSPQPFIIKVNGIHIDKDNLLISSSVGLLSVGDTLAIMPMDNRQTFVILCKVVNVS
jgi:hypothetical protein